MESKRNKIAEIITLSSNKNPIELADEILLYLGFSKPKSKLCGFYEPSEFNNGDSICKNCWQEKWIHPEPRTHHLNL